MASSPEEAKYAAQKEVKPRSAMASPNLGGMSPRTQGNSKAVSIIEPGGISPQLPGSARDDDADNEGPLSLGPHGFRPSKTKKHRVTLRRPGSRTSIDLLQKARTPADLLHLPAHGDGGRKPSTQPGRASPPLSPNGNGAAALVTNVIATASKAPSIAAASEKQDKLDKGSKKGKHALPKGHLTYHDLMKWIQREKSRRASTKATKKEKKKSAKAKKEPSRPPEPEKSVPGDDKDGVQDDDLEEQDSKTSDVSSEGSVALEMLQDILERNVSIFQNPFANRSSTSIRRPGSLRRLRRTSTAASSDTDFYDGEPSVPSCEVVLDNSRTFAPVGEDTSADPSKPDSDRSQSNKTSPCWQQFKYETVRLAHTLKVKGWRRVPMARSEEIQVDRLSGALTNCVYVVTPPQDLMEGKQAENDQGKPDRRPKPRKLLLRIYGAQVEHLIDREGELAILRRLARKRIGPRMLGTFKNGRFEEHFNARPLTAEELRQPACSRHIAKRMRELHDGIELIHDEVAAGPFVWQNIDKWMKRSEKIVEWLEQHRGESSETASQDRVVAADFSLFKEALTRYRKWLEEKYNGWDAIRERLVFAHNDAQYGNILRLQGEDESMITPENEHKQLIVIDFEYANANVPGLEFANHFTEWCYNYHDPHESFLCKVPQYPNAEEQTNFFASYISHQPNFPPARGTLSHRASTTSLASFSTSVPTTPSSMHPSAPAVGMISSFMLEARSQPSTGGIPTLAGLAAGTSSSGNPHDAAEEEVQGEIKRREIERLRWETRAWRGVNSAQWVMWGVVQAKVAGMPNFVDMETPEICAKIEGDIPESEALPAPSTDEKFDPRPRDNATGTLISNAQGEDEEDEEFDYLKYAFERARFFWGDILALGIMKEDELPEEVRALARILDY